MNHQIQDEGQYIFNTEPMKKEATQVDVNIFTPLTLQYDEG